MNLFTQVKTLIYKDVLLEWRSKYAINSILLYVVSTVFVCYQSFKSVDSPYLNTLFWIILLFAAINALSRSFLQETGSRQLYYTSASYRHKPLSWLKYATIPSSCCCFLARHFWYNLIFSNEVGHWGIYMLSILLGSISFATVFTMVAGISAKAGNNSTIMAILSFPVIIPLLIVLIKLSQQGVIGGNFEASWKDISVLLAINVVTIAISLLLFPYLWRD